MTTTFIKFSNTRKAMIAHLKSFLKDPFNRPYKDEQYGTKYKRLFLEDYAVYAVLRGKDYRKTSHLENASNAKAALESVLHKLKNAISSTGYLDACRKKPLHPVSRYFDAETKISTIVEMIEIIKAALQHIPGQQEVLRSASFTNSRNAMIAHLKAILTNPDNRPYKNENGSLVKQYGPQYKRLFLVDYAVYAVLRGKDYRKISHLEDGRNAKDKLDIVLTCLNSAYQSILKSGSLKEFQACKWHPVNRYFSSDMGVDEVKELSLLIESALEKHGVGHAA